MTAYYNENDPYAAAWLRELIKANLIVPGDVDERSIAEVRPDDLRGYTQCHFFAGIGVWSYALRNAGWADATPVWTGSCPCQSFSASGKRGGFSDKRHLWPVWFRLIEECKPDTVFGEQVASKDGLAWFDVVSADLEGADYAVGAADICAAGLGAPHIRQRLYFVADSASYRWTKARQSIWRQSTEPQKKSWGWDGRMVQPRILPLATGAPARVGRLRGYGNSIVAPVAQAFIEAFIETRVSEPRQGALR